MLKYIITGAGVFLGYLLFQKIQAGSKEYAEFMVKVKDKLQHTDLSNAENRRVIEFVHKVGYPTHARVEYCMGRKPFNQKLMQFLEDVYDKKIVKTYMRVKKKYLFSDWNTELFTEPVIQHNYEDYLVHILVFI